MSEIIKPGEVGQPDYATRIMALEDVVAKQGQIIRILDQYLVLQKGFFDQIKVNKIKDKVVKDDPVKEVEIVEEN